MATTRDYIDYLNDQVDIAPVNSQEELDAAQLIQSLMEQHALETKIQEFDAPSSGSGPYRIAMMMLFIGLVLSGFYGTPAGTVGVVIVFIIAALFLLKELGYDFLAGLGGRARSQNVIGVHRAEGPLVMKGNRPIVIVAHYDTARESFLYRKPFATVQPFMKRYAPACIAIASVLGIFQIFGFVPEIARRVLWVIGLMVSLPLLTLGIESIYRRFSSCTDGANDNKAGVAAMLGVMSKVRPGDDAATGYAQIAAERRASMPAEPEEEEGEPEDESFDEEYDDEPSDDFDLEGFGLDEVADVPVADEYVAVEAVDDEPMYEPAPEAEAEPAPEPEAAYEPTFEPEYEAADAFVPEPEPVFEPVTPATFEVETDEQLIDADLGAMPYEEPVEAPQVADDVILDAEFEVLDEEAEAPVAPAAPVEEPFAAPDSYVEEEAVAYNDAVVENAYDTFGEMPLDELPAEDEDLYAGLDTIPVEQEEESEEEQEEEPYSFVPSFARVRHAEPEPEPVEPEVAPQIVTDRYETVEGVRHGKDVISSLRMLPSSCKIEYVEPRLVSRTVRPEDEVDRADFGVLAPGAGHEDAYDYGDGEDEVEGFSFGGIFDKVRGFFANLGRRRQENMVLDASYEEANDDYDNLNDDFAYDFEPLPEQAYQPASEPVYVPEASYMPEPVYVPEPEFEPLDPTLGATDPNLAMDDEPFDSVIAPGISFTDEPLPTDEEIDLMDGSGLTEVVEDDLSTTNPQLIKPAPKAEAIDDPMWGTSEYVPPVRSVGRRASLFDLPDPSSLPQDPFGKAPKNVAPKEQASSSSLSLVEDDDFEDDEHWKGGATTRAGLRTDEEGAEETAFEDAPFDDMPFGAMSFDAMSDIEDFANADVEPLDEQEQEELRDAILSMRDDELVAHDIWFVALGASELNHAGMASFLRENRSKIRGAFMVNLSCIGAGELNLLSSEGLINTRRTDRRVMRLLSNIADDLHIPIKKSAHIWEDTDATQAMRKSVRALTIMGLENGVPALSHTMEDTYDNVDPAQVSDVTAMLTELIRRS